IGRSADAIAATEERVALLERLAVNHQHNRLLLMQAYEHLCDEYRLKGEISKARTTINKSLVMANSDTQMEPQMQAYLRLSLLAYDEGDTAQSLKLADTCIAAAKKCSQSEQVIGTGLALQQKANAYAMQGKSKEALASYEAAVKEFDKLKECEQLQ